MPRRTLIFAIVTAACLGILFLASLSLNGSANAIDEVHWTGDPMPPCFVDAAHCAGHVLGTDEVGRDLFARLVVGARSTLGVSLLAVGIEVLIALALGAPGRSGRVAGIVVRRTADLIVCLPPWPALAAFVVFFFLPGAGGPKDAVRAFGAACILVPRMLQLILGGSPLPVLFRRALNDWADAILLLATIDFFGLGLQPPWPSWGNMLFNLEQNFLMAWWSAVFPAACIFLSVLALRLSALAEDWRSSR